MADRISVTIEDIGGSFARLRNDSPKVAYEYARDAVTKTTFALAQRIRAKAPVGPDAPHIRDAVTTTVRGLTGKAGFINATEKAAPHNPATLAEVALYNEYRPNVQPFMRPAAESEASDFAKRMTEAVRQIERAFGGVGI